MNAGVVILLIILIVGILVGIGVGLYFLLRKPAPSSGGGTGPPGGVTGPAPPIPIIPVPGVTGTRFSIQSVKFPSDYLVLNTTYPAGTSQTQIPVIYGTSTAIPCTNYSWQLIPSITVGGQTLTNALVNNANSTTVGGTTVNSPFITSLDGSANNNLVLGSNVSDLAESSWTYNSTNKTWCNGNNLCIYITDTAITARPYVSTDTAFQWNNVPVLTSPHCR